MIESIENGRKEDGNRSIADKIIKRLHDLDKMVENNQGRWAWELLQNAKDSIADYDDRKVTVQIILNTDHVEFKHNGLHFTEQDIRGLINQISSKEISKDQVTKKTGRFGTGFLTTHLLSKVIQVKGVVETQNKDFYSFEFPLDREGKTTTDLVPKIENAWKEFHKSAKKISNYDQFAFNTSFSYHLKTDEQKNIAKIGVEEFSKLIPFVLAFIPKISKVEIFNMVLKNEIVYESSDAPDENSILEISKVKNGQPEVLYILLNGNERISIAAEVHKTSKGFAFKSNQDIPKLFCDFPLIGSESFHFPVVINSFYFNPQTERDGIWLKGKKEGIDPEVDENQQLMVEAVSLFQDLINHTLERSFSDFYNIAITNMPGVDEKYFDESWYRKNIQSKLREYLFTSPVIELDDENENKITIENTWFPMRSYSTVIRERLWQLIFDIVPASVCKKEHLHQWCDESWDEWKKINYGVVMATIAARKTIENLGETLNKNERETLIWLNSAFKFILEDEANLAAFKKNEIVPNKKGVLKKSTELFSDNIQDVDLIEVLRLLGEDWNDILIHKNVVHGDYAEKDKKSIADRITLKLKASPTDDDSIKAISILSEWFEHNRDLGKELFSELYRKRAELFMNTITDKESLYKVMRSKTELSKLSEIAEQLESNPQLLENLKKGEELNSLLSEFNIKDVNELKNILQSARVKQKMEMTQEVLASLGVNSLEELEEALKDKDLADQFTHVSKPNVAAFVYAQGLIERAKKNIISHLNTLPNYDCSGLEILARSVLGGIKKDGVLIHVVVRPSDNGMVIVYYSSEKDSLDYENAELWIENGRTKPRHLTLGRVLKLLGVNKIPV